MKKLGYMTFALAAFVGGVVGCSLETSSSGRSSLNASNEEPTTIATLQDLPNCDGKSNGDVVFVVKEQHDYECKKGKWILVDESSITECTAANEGVIWHSSEDDTYYECLDEEWIETAKSSSSNKVASSSSRKTSFDEKDDVEDDDDDVLSSSSSKTEVSSSTRVENIVDDRQSSSSKSTSSSSSEESDDLKSSASEVCVDGDTYVELGVNYVCEDGELVLQTSVSSSSAKSSSSTAKDSSSSSAVTESTKSSAAEDGKKSSASAVCTEVQPVSVLLSNSLGTDQYALNMETGLAENPDITIKFVDGEATIVPSAGVTVVEEGNSQDAGLLPTAPVCLENFKKTSFGVEDLNQNLWVVVTTAAGKDYPMMIGKIMKFSATKGSVAITYYKSEQIISAESSSSSAIQSSASVTSSAAVTSSGAATAMSLAPFYFEGVAEENQQAYWERLMKYKLFGEKGIELKGQQISITDTSGWVGTSNGDLSTLNGYSALGGAVLIGGNILFVDDGCDSLTTGPVRVTGNFETSFNGRGTYYVKGDFCAGNVVAESDPFNGGSRFTAYFGTEYENCPSTVPEVWTDLSIPMVDFSDKGSMPMLIASGQTVYIDVPPGEGPYDLWYESISFANGGDLHIRMPAEGRLTRIFVYNSIVGFGAALGTDIVVKYASGDAVFENGTWNGEMLDESIKGYSGDLIVYVNDDMILGAGEKTLQGSYIVNGSMNFAQNTEFVGQILARNVVLDANSNYGRYASAKTIISKD